MPTSSGSAHTSRARCVVDNNADTTTYHMTEDGRMAEGSRLDGAWFGEGRGDDASTGRIAASYALAFACFAIAGWMVFGGLGESPPDRPAFTWHREAVHRASIDTSHQPTTREAPPPGVRATAIEAITVGQRVLARNPELSDADRAALSDEPTEATWRKVTLSMRKPTGDAIAITLLRPLDWID